MQHQETRLAAESEAKNPLLKQLLDELSESPESVMNRRETGTFAEYLERWLLDVAKARVGERTLNVRWTKPLRGS